MVRSFVAERGLAEARAEALAAGMTRLQERLAMWCLRSREARRSPNFYQRPAGG
jgi:hypothetical protein